VDTGSPTRTRAKQESTAISGRSQNRIRCSSTGNGAGRLLFERVAEQPAPLPCGANCGKPRAVLEAGWAGAMTEHAEVAYTVADGNDYIEHERTYVMFVTLVKWAVAAIAVVLILMAIFLV
jgi:hypothetical protein